MVGLDTGYFMAMIKGHSKALTLWDKLQRKSKIPVVSVLTLGELAYLYYRIGEPEKGQRLVENIKILAIIKSVDENIAIRAASLKHGLAIPFIDALIMATFLEAGCKEIHTTDKKHFSKLTKKELKLIFY